MSNVEQDLQTYCKAMGQPTQLESDALMAWAKAHSGVYGLTKLVPKDDAVRVAASEAWDAIERLYNIVKTHHE